MNVVSGYLGRCKRQCHLHGGIFGNELSIQQYMLHVYFVISNGRGERGKDMNIGLVFEYMRFADKIIRELLNII